jgi:hypothetical protein
MSTGRAPAYPPWRPRKRLRSRIRGYFTEPQRLSRLAISTFLSFGFVLLVLDFTNGRLLYSVDFQGVYTPAFFAHQPTPDFLIPSIGAALSGGDFYAGQYISLFLDAFVCTYFAQLLVWEMFKKTFTARQFLGVQTLAGALYLINPYTITWGSYTLETNLFLSQAAIFLVLAELVRLGRFVRAGQPFRWYDAALLGVGIGLSDPLAFPNMVRILAIELGLLLIFTVAILYFLRSRAQREAEWTSAKRITVATFPTAILLLSYALYTFLESWLLNPASLSTVEYIDRNSIVSNNFGPMINILRLWGKQNFLSYPYGPAFLHSPLLIGASLLWPVLALAIPLLVAPYVVRVDRLWIYLAIVVVLPCIFWGNGNSAPFGSINTGILSALHLPPETLPPFFPIEELATKIFPVLAAFSVGFIYRIFLSWDRPYTTTTGAATAPAFRASRLGATPPAPFRLPRTSRRRGLGRPIAFLVTIGIVAMIIVSVEPIFDGTIYEINNGVPSPWALPSAYLTARNVLLDNSSNALVLPQLSPYFGTTWGWRGASSLYVSLYYPSKILVPGYYGAYVSLLPTTQQLYAVATHPLYPGTATKNNSLYVGSTPHSWLQSPTNPFVFTYFLPTTANYKNVANNSINIDRFSWLQINFTTNDPCLYTSLAQAGELWAGLLSPNPDGSGTLTGWYTLGTGGNSFMSVTAQPDCEGSGVVQYWLLIGSPTTKENYIPTDVIGYQIWIHGSPIDYGLGNPSVLGMPHVAGIPRSTVFAEWTQYMLTTDMRYLLVDNSITYGREEPESYVNATVNELESVGWLTPVFLTPDLQMYQFNQTAMRAQMASPSLST